MSGSGPPDQPVRCWEDEIQRLRRVLLIVYLLEDRSGAAGGTVVDVLGAELAGRDIAAAGRGDAAFGRTRRGLRRRCGQSVRGVWELAASLLALVRPVGVTPQDGICGEDTSPWPEGR